MTAGWDWTSVATTSAAQDFFGALFVPVMLIAYVFFSLALDSLWGAR
jgi:hypothetical protein